MKQIDKIFNYWQHKARDMEIAKRIIEPALSKQQISVADPSNKIQKKGGFLFKNQEETDIALRYYWLESLILEFRKLYLEGSWLRYLTLSVMETICNFKKLDMDEKVFMVIELNRSVMYYAQKLGVEKEIEKELDEAGI